MRGVHDNYNNNHNDYYNDHYDYHDNYYDDDKLCSTDEQVVTVQRL